MTIAHSLALAPPLSLSLSLYRRVSKRIIGFVVISLNLHQKRAPNVARNRPTNAIPNFISRNVIIYLQLRQIIQSGQRRCAIKRKANIGIFNVVRKNGKSHNIWNISGFLWAKHKSCDWMANCAA